MISLKERSVSNEEMGMFWRDTEHSWWWYRAPIETQAMMIEAFDEVMNDVESVEDCRVWLLKQKQTRDWKTTKATADAIYSLLLRGSDLLASDALVQVSLGDLKIEPQQVEAGTGFYQERFLRKEVEPAMGRVTVTKTDPGVAWGSVHWQYLEDMSKITPYEGTPLTLKKQLFIKENTKKGPVLNAVDGPISVGDELVVRHGTARRSRYGIRAPEGPARQWPGASQCAVAIPLSRWTWLLRVDARHGQPFLHRLLAQRDLRLRVFNACGSPGRVPIRDGPNPVHVCSGIQQPQRKPADSG